MPLLVDGNNLLYAARKVSRFRSIEPDQLCRLLARWAATRRTHVTIVFDGPRPALGIVQRMSSPDVAVRFSAGRTADDVLEDMLAHDSGAAQYTVITSDHAVQHAARYHRAAAVDAEQFVHDELVGGVRDTPAPVEGTDKPEALSAEETAHWLRQFGQDPDEPPDETDVMMT